MCGIYGWVPTDPGGQPDLDILEAAAVAAGTRGPHAHGWAMSVPDDSGLLPIAHRSLGKTDTVQLLATVPTARPTAIVGHARLATTAADSAGSIGDVQPIRGWTSWLAHNGSVDVPPAMARRMKTGVDSEAILLAMQDLTHEYAGVAYQAWRLGLGLTRLEVDRRPHAILLLHDTGQLLGSRTRLPLFVHEHRTGTYVCSRPLAKGDGILPDGRVHLIGPHHG